MDIDTTSRQGTGVEAANSGKREIAITIDITHHQTQLITMRRQHDARFSRRIEGGNDITMYIGAYLIAIGTKLLANYLLYRLLKTRWARSGNHFAQKRDTQLIHKTLLFPTV